MKKNIIFMVALFVGAMLFSSFTKNDCNSTPSTTELESQSNLVFRGTQRFRSNDGRELYCYTNSKCEMYDGDRLVVTCTYTYSGDEIRLLDENGNTVYKGSVYWNNSHSKPISITIAGTTYRNKD
ncbi:MAG: hypothetical protein J5671_09650 [Bacteroidaceae bacterium]|nr:hypothetical protein [Bacteroidaceae bacterium]